ncbi:unnamed protein product [Didymodactylos carnosus]|uniref:HAT C-terminal dimerisation domain-containing protein n=1 Tax=Didymodactylos carnosus TaxID=1234261 RepID=A0A814TLD8_9BILA|nr:unnamed protein product [Didymodactylos carnosus]CAF3927340.1 unnamed protein product [Didymodactylos carnosus]
MMNAACEQLYLKLFKQILDQLYMDYNDYLILLKNKLKWFTNITPDRVEVFSIDDATNLGAIIPNLNHPELLLSDFELLRNDIKQCNDMNTVVDMLKNRQNIYPRLAAVYNFLLSLSITLATNESAFSKMNSIKNYLHTTLSNKKFASLMICSVENDMLDKVNLKCIAHES